MPKFWTTKVSKSFLRWTNYLKGWFDIIWVVKLDKRQNIFNYIDFLTTIFLFIVYQRKNWCMICLWSTSKKITAVKYLRAEVAENCLHLLTFSSAFRSQTNPNPISLASLNIWTFPALRGWLNSCQFIEHSSIVIQQNTQKTNKQTRHLHRSFSLRNQRIIGPQSVERQLNNQTLFN